MSERTGRWTRAAEASADLSVGRTAGVVAAAAFWGWLLLRWLNNWLLPAGVGVPPGEPFVDPNGVRALGVVVEIDLVAFTVRVDLAGLFDSFAFAVEFLPALADGAWLTVVLTVVSIALGFVIAVPLSVARVYGRYSAYLSLAYTELLRGTPLLAQLFVLYYGLNLSQYVRGLPLEGLFPGPAVYVATLGFVLNSAAYQAEYIRTALLSVDERQLRAARAVGLSQLEGIRFVALPQGLRYAIPGWSNELVYLIKYSSLAAFVTVPELFNVANAIASDNLEYTSIFTLVALIYLGLVISAANLTERLERAVSVPGIGASSESR